jgi:hypothetical protein
LAHPHTANSERSKLGPILQHAALHHFEVLVVAFPWVLHPDPAIRAIITAQLAQFGVEVHIVHPDQET